MFVHEVIRIGSNIIFVFRRIGCVLDALSRFRTHYSRTRTIERAANSRRSYLRTVNKTRDLAIGEPV